MDWIGSSLSLTQSLAANTTVAHYIVLPSEVRDQFIDPTLICTRGSFAAYAAAAPVMAAIGIIDWMDQDDTPPASADAPSPLTATHDWIWHSFLQVPTGAGATLSTFGQADGIDSKAMRRLGGRKGILLVISNLVTSASFNYLFGVRCLLKD